MHTDMSLMVKLLLHKTASKLRSRSAAVAIKSTKAHALVRHLLCESCLGVEATGTRVEGRVERRLCLRVEGRSRGHGAQQFVL